MQNNFLKSTENNVWSLLTICNTINQTWNYYLDCKPFYRPHIYLVTATLSKHIKLKPELINKISNVDILSPQTREKTSLHNKQYVHYKRDNVSMTKSLSPSCYMHKTLSDTEVRNILQQRSNEGTLPSPVPSIYSHFIKSQISIIQHIPCFNQIYINNMHPIFILIYGQKNANKENSC